MAENIYQSRAADLCIEETKRGSPIKAVLISAAVDIVGTLVGGTILGIGYGAILAANGISSDEIIKAGKNIELYSAISILGMAFWSIISFYAGYLCAKIANHMEYKIVAITGAISVLFGLLLGSSRYSAIENIFFSMLTLLCVYLGAWLHVRTKQKHNVGN